MQTFPTSSDDFWDYGLKMDVIATGVLELGTGDLFQVRWGTTKRFRELYAAMQQAISWETANGIPDAVAVEPPSTTSSTFVLSLGDEIEKLASLRERGFLTDEEFAAAKAHLLGAGR